MQPGCAHCGKHKQTHGHISNSEATYTCPMHPEIQQQGPGFCPICGMDLEPLEPTEVLREVEYHVMLKRLWISGFLAFAIILLSINDMTSFFGAISVTFGHWLQFLLTIPIMFWAGWFIFERAWASVIQCNLNMFSLIALGVGAAFVLSVIALLFPEFFPSTYQHGGAVPVYFETAAVIIVLVLLGQVLELKARSKTSTAIKKLLSKAAKVATVVRASGNEEQVPIEKVLIGDILRIRPGEKVAVDGTIIEGSGIIDESMITGEAIPIVKKVNEWVVGGTINRTGSFLMKAEKVGNDTLLARIIAMVINAQRSRAPIQRLADTVSGWFVPAVVLVAVLTALAWGFFGPTPALKYALLNAVSVLIIACPCALGLATPISIMVGIGRGAENGILIKNAEALERLEKANMVCIDKTGTLTEGKPSLINVKTAHGWNRQEVLSLVASVEQLSEHPLARLFVEEAQRQSLKLKPVEDFQSETGIGVSGMVEGKRISIGKKKSLDFPNDFPDGADDTTFTLLDANINGETVGSFAVEDRIKDSAFQALGELHRLGIKVVLLSGDRELVVQKVAQSLHIDEAYGEIMPQQKHDYVVSMKTQGNLVAMAGDGINDAPALAVADVGIAMGSGTDVAIEAGEVTLMKGDLMGIVRAIHLSRAVMKNIRQNLFFAFAYNVLSIPLAAGVLFPFLGWLLNPMVAAFAMSLSSVSVIANALRLRKFYMS